jgi:hypothetical protein
VGRVRACVRGVGRCVRARLNDWNCMRVRGLVGKVGVRARVRARARACVYLIGSSCI